ncbi:MAG TPA: hypothetical protein VM388_12030 [Acidimicrobiales bacterium]|nr:hypothetical protein [Acidimicrobiales bacterium]
MAQQAIVTPRPMPAARPRKAPAKRAAATTKDTTKRETRRVTSTAKAEARQVKGAAVGGTKVVARTAQQDVRQLAGTVRSQAEQVKGELAGQARGMLAETQGQLQAQADMQASRLASALFQVGGQAVALSQGRPEQAGPLVDYAEQAATWLDDRASYIEERGLEGLATDVVDFARRRPGVFLAGAAVVGFGVGRLLRSGAVSAESEVNGAYGELEA